jgi:hypothetical protein
LGTRSLAHATNLTGLLIVVLAQGRSGLPVRSRPGSETRQRRQLHGLVRWRFLKGLQYYMLFAVLEDIRFGDL